MAIHELKTIQPFFNDIKSGEKTFELRKNDRNFDIMDKVILKEYDQMRNKFTGEMISIYITYILKNRVGLDDDYCIFSFIKE